LALGLVNAVVPPEELLPYTYNYVRTLITTVSPASLRESKRPIYRALHRDVRTAITDSVALVERMVTEPDFTEGVSAFVEKRPPQWGKQQREDITR
jgi:enoyl-CoA hydratase/carnithine racemase